MINNLDDIQKLSQSNVDTAVKVFGDWNKNLQSLAAEFGAYSKRTFDDSASTFERLVGAKSVEQALEIQADFAKRQMNEYVQQVAKIGDMYTDIAKDAYKPFENGADGRSKVTNGSS